MTPHSLGKVILSILALSLGLSFPLHSQDPAQDPAALLQAVEKSDSDRVRQLLLGSARPDIRNAKGETALMLAAKAGSFEICRALLWAGANANANATDKVMTQNTSLAQQTPGPGGAWDDDWVHEQWRGKE